MQSSSDRNCYFFRYVFEGLGHLISFILINSAQYIKRINENGIKKMYVHDILWPFFLRSNMPLINIYCLFYFYQLSYQLPPLFISQPFSHYLVYSSGGTLRSVTCHWLKMQSCGFLSNSWEHFALWIYRCRNIFILQQNLTNITMSRETDLDHARNYYELMYKNTDVSSNWNLETQMGDFCPELRIQPKFAVSSVPKTPVELGVFIFNFVAVLTGLEMSLGPLDRVQ